MGDTKVTHLGSEGDFMDTCHWAWLASSPPTAPSPHGTATLHGAAASAEAPAVVKGESARQAAGADTTPDLHARPCRAVISGQTGSWDATGGKAALRDVCAPAFLVTSGLPLITCHIGRSP